VRKFFAGALFEKGWIEKNIENIFTRLVSVFIGIDVEDLSLLKNRKTDHMLIFPP
jgi:hypothetical protein